MKILLYFKSHLFFLIRLKRSLRQFNKLSNNIILYAPIIDDFDCEGNLTDLGSNIIWPEK